VEVETSFNNFQYDAKCPANECLNGPEDHVSETGYLWFWSMNHKNGMRMTGGAKCYRTEILVGNSLSMNMKQKLRCGME
jgi:hypothetical protein